MNGCSLLTRFLTAKDDQSKNSTKFLKFMLQNTENQILNGFITGFHPQTQKLEPP